MTEIVRKQILDDATNCVCGQREDDYGSPENNFYNIAKLWNAYLGDTIFDSHDVGIMMALLKIARIRSGRHKQDSYIDACGYIACAGELACNDADNQ